MSNDRIHQLEAELFESEHLLEKEKAKRNIIIILVYAVIIFACFVIAGKHDGTLDILGDAFLSVILGGVLFFVSVACFSITSTIFTKVQSIEDNVQRLKSELRKYQDDNYDEF